MDGVAPEPPSGEPVTALSDDDDQPQVAQDNPDDPEHVVDPVQDDGDRVLTDVNVEKPRPTLQASPMPVPNIADIPLHSPSSIVGTPFNDELFEYPFPSPAASNSPEMSPTFSSISPSPSAGALVSASHPQLPTSISAPPALQHLPASFPTPAELSSAYTIPIIHPKMRAGPPPPEPPSLTKRRQRWTLGLGSLTRKLSLRSGSAPVSASQSGSPPAEAESSHRRVQSERDRAAEAKGQFALTSATPPSTT